MRLPAHGGPAIRLASAVLVTACALGVAAPTSSASFGHQAWRVSGINPANFSNVVDNRYFPLKPGTTYTYTGIKDGQPSRTTVVVTHRTRRIAGVTCVVVRDTLKVRGRLAERTIDWYAQDRAGNVWYFGESSHDYKNGKLVTTQGSWEAGVRGARPGIIMEAHPRVGDTYGQEHLSRVAADHAAVVSLSRLVRVPYGSFRSALMTREWSPLEPGVVEHKFYVSGVGNVYTVMVKGGSDRDSLARVRHTRPR